MKLMTKANYKSLPGLYATENESDPLVRVKFFTPDANWTWYAISGEHVDEDGIIVSESGKPAVDYLFFGLVDGFEVELGYFSLNELQSVRGKLGLPIERDMYFTPARLSVIREKIGR